ncbi:Porin domain, Gram-negative type [Candidatus Pelagibacterales bacterium]
MRKYRETVENLQFISKKIYIETVVIKGIATINFNINVKMKNMLTRTALVSSVMLSVVSAASAQTTVSGNLAIVHKNITSDIAAGRNYQFFGKEAQINLASKGTLSNGLGYAAGFSLEFDGADANETAYRSAVLQGATNENTYIDFIAGNTTVTFGADHIQNPDFSMANLIGVIDIDDAVSGVTNASKVGQATSFTTTKNSAYQAYGVGVVQTIPSVGKLSLNYNPDRTTGLANGDTMSISATNTTSLYDTGNSAYEIGFVGDLGVKGLTVAAFMNKSDSGAAGVNDLEGRMYAAKYNMGQVTVAAERGITESAAATSVKLTSDAFAIAYAVTPAISVGLSYAKTDISTAALPDETIKQISLGYNLGAITVGASYAKVSDIGNTAGLDGDTLVARASLNF